LKYVLHENKRLYFKQSDEHEIQSYYNSLLIEQDIDSPHRYEYKDFKVNEGGTVLDVGAAEGIFSLSVVDRASRLYIIEADESWLPALEATFAPWRDKVTIINKYIANYQAAATCDLDSYFRETLETPANFIKVDVEAGEMPLLNGAQGLLAAQPNMKIAICTYHRQKDAEEINNALMAQGFHTEFSKGYMIFESWLRDREPSFYIRKGLIRAGKNVT
jgi:hypothetical protein